jgi:hypothetical protein
VLSQSGELFCDCETLQHFWYYFSIQERYRVGICLERMISEYTYADFFGTRGREGSLKFTLYRPNFSLKRRRKR